MRRDHDEWKRPWTAAGAAPARVAGAAGVEARDDGGVLAAPQHDPHAPFRPPAAGGDGHGGDVLPPPDVDSGALGLLPQPPPPTWGEDNEGPGSPIGSIRPPDVTGTVEAPPRRPGTRQRSGMALGLVGALIGGVIGTAGTLAVVRTTPSFGTGPSVRAPVVETTGGTTSTTPGTVVSAVAQAVTPSVVRVDVLTEVTDDENPLTSFEEQAGLGSGVIYRSDGYVLTNNHVVEAADALRIRLANGKTLDAEVVGTDALNDLAVLRVEETGLPAVNLREEPLVVGETAIAIGSPFGLDASVTAGVVSAINREIQVPGEEGALVIPAVVQTDAAINPGNSGGALVDASGRLIGINTAILTGSGGSQGVGFAIPVEQAVASADELIEQGFVRHPFLGITGVDVTPEVAAEFDLDVEEGAVVDSVQEGTAADEAGLEANDIIVGMNGEPIESMSDLVLRIRRQSPGDEVNFEVLRGDERLELTATLGERPR